MQGNTLYRVSAHQTSQKGQNFFSLDDKLLFHQLNNKGNFSQYNCYKKITYFYKMPHILTLKGHQVHIIKRKAFKYFD